MISITKKNASSYDKNAQSWNDAIKDNVSHKYLEKPAMSRELPNSFEGKVVLSIGVGSGEEFKEILERKPDRVVGIDVSKELLKITSKKYPIVELVKMDMMDMSFADESFDYVYSSLTFHYADDWDVLLEEVSRVLKRGGTLLFSTLNPSYWSLKPETGNTYTNERGVTLKEHTAFLSGGVEIIYYNHPNKKFIREAIEHAGFEIQSFFKPSVVNLQVSAKELEDYNRLRDKNTDNPLLLIVGAVKL